MQGREEEIKLKYRGSSAEIRGPWKRTFEKQRRWERLRELRIGAWPGDPSGQLGMWVWVCVV